MLERIRNAIRLYQGLPKDIYVIALARFILGLGNFIIPFLVLLFTQKLDYSPSVAGGLAMSVTALYLLGGLLGGKLSDSFGHKRVLIWGELLGAILLLVCGFFPESHLYTPMLLFVSYFFFGVAVPASMALVGDLSTPKNRDAVMSLSYLAYNLGSGVGPILAGYLFWNYTAWIFWGNGLAALIGVLIILIGVNSTHQTQHDQEHSELEKATDGSIWKVLSLRPRLIVFTLLCGVLWFSLNQMTMTTPLYLSHLFDKQGAILFGQLMTFASILVVLITPILMQMTKTQCEIKSLAWSGGLFAFGYWLVFINSSIPMQFVAWFFLSAAEVLLLTKEGVYLANHSPSSHRGRINGVLSTLRNVMVMPSYILVGVYIEQQGYQNTWLTIIACSVIASMLLLALSIQQQQKTLSVKA
ncbi:MFS transporter [Vibrio sp. Of7-15]|uniref:MFS transporter n=1 Tax=Vibrio sp. Of7-15 TaxID=2724879 RepID=UPI001EF28A8A|nr:MFS transporter [Vibrio sp. Of7-15]MCG7498042.1 MFS transporter [Vibrio sp. Of7-15]